MKFKRLYAISQKEYYHIIRDPISLGLSFLMPVLLLFLFGYAISFDINKIKTVILDEDKSNLSREFIKKYEESGYFKVVNYLEKEKEIDKFLNSSKAVVGIWIPENFSKKIKGKNKPEVQIIIDGSDSNTASIILSYIYGISGNLSQKISNVGNYKINLKTRFWYNQDLKSKNFIIPGLIALIIAIISALLSSLTISREWERGTMEKLISTQIKPSELILGKLIPYFIVGILDVIFAVIIALIFFNVPFKGNFLFLLFVSSIFLFSGLSFGILISIIARSQLLSIQMSVVLTYLPTLLLSGFIFAIENMPEKIKVLTYIVPARYFVYIIRNIFLKGSPVNFLIFESLILFIFALFFFFLQSLNSKKA